MSHEILQKLSSHLGLSSIHPVRYFSWTDIDLNGAGEVFLLRMAGTGGSDDEVLQYLDVSLQLLCAPNAALAGSQQMLGLRRFLRTPSGSSNVALGLAGVVPFGPTAGPSKLQNDRTRFEMVIRVMVEDH